MKNLKQKFTDYINALSDELRSKIEHRKNRPFTPKLRKICSLVVVLCSIIYLCIGCFGGIKSSAADVPTDLTGYTVTVPAGWSASSGFGLFQMRGTLEVGPPATFPSNSLTFVGASVLGIGYNRNLDSISDRVGVVSALDGDGNSINSVITNDRSLTFYFGAVVDNGSNDYPYVNLNSNFIQWLVGNDAVFTNNNVPSTVTVPAGLYFLQNASNDLRGTIDFSAPFLSKSTYFSSIEFVGVENNQYVSINYVDSSDNITNVYYAQEGWQFNEYSVILLNNPVQLSQEQYTLFSSAFVSFADNPDLDTLFKAGQENGQSFGYSLGYDDGLDDGYEDGYSVGFQDGRADGMSSGFMSNFFGSIIQALDALKIFGEFSVLNIIEGVLGLMLALWILKLIAGG